MQSQPLYFTIYLRDFSELFELSQKSGGKYQKRMKPNYFIKCHPYIPMITDSNRLNSSTTDSASKKKESHNQPRTIKQWSNQKNQEVIKRSKNKNQKEAERIKKTYRSVKRNS